MYIASRRNVYIMYTQRAAGQARRTPAAKRATGARRDAKVAGAHGRRGASADGLTTQAYQRVRDAILRGEHAPGGVLFETHLAGELGMSRTPVREALQLLAREGFVEIVANRGYFVPRLSMSDLRELYELREVLEGFAARCATLRATDAEIDDLEQLMRRYARAPAWEAWARIGTEFHNRIVSLGSNQRLGSLLDSLKGQISLTRETQLREVRGRRDESVLEHRAILDAIRKRDPDEAERQARAHVRVSYEAVLRALQSGRRP